MSTFVATIITHPLHDAGDHLFFGAIDGTPVVGALAPERQMKEAVARYRAGHSLPGPYREMARMFVSHRTPTGAPATLEDLLAPAETVTERLRVSLEVQEGPETRDGLTVFSVEDRPTFALPEGTVLPEDGVVPEPLAETLTAYYAATWQVFSQGMLLEETASILAAEGVLNTQGRGLPQSELEDLNETANLIRSRIFTARVNARAAAKNLLTQN